MESRDIEGTDCQIEKQFADDIKHDKEPTVNIRKEHQSIESEQVPLEDLEIKLNLARNPEEYPENRLQRVVGSELHAKQGDTIKYYKSDTTGGGTSNTNLVSRREYLEMLRTTLQDSLSVMGYDFMRDIAGYRKLHDCVNRK